MLSKIFKSKPGRIAVIAFLIFSVLSIIYAIFCDGWFCGVWGLVPALPWVFLGGSMVNNEGSWIFWVMGFLMNVIVIYFLGQALGKIKNIYLRSIIIIALLLAAGLFLFN